MNPQDPLAELRDLAQVEAIPFWPPAPGWWILASLIILAVVFGLRIWRKRYLRAAYRREALDELKHFWLEYQRDQNTLVYLKALTSLLKRTALSAYPENACVGATGQRWLNFLDDSLGKKPAGLSFSEDGQLLLNGPYMAECQDDPSKVHTLALAWISAHSTKDLEQGAQAHA